MNSLEATDFADAYAGAVMRFRQSRCPHSVTWSAGAFVINELSPSSTSANIECFIGSRWPSLLGEIISLPPIHEPNALRKVIVARLLESGAAGTLAQTLKGAKPD